MRESCVRACVSACVRACVRVCVGGCGWGAVVGVGGLVGGVVGGCACVRVCVRGACGDVDVDGGRRLNTGGYGFVSPGLQARRGGRVLGGELRG